MLNTALAQTIANTVATKIVNQTKNLKLPVESWKTIVELIVNEVFTQIKINAVVEVQELVTFTPGPGLITGPGGGPVTGVIAGPASSVYLKGKIT